MSQSYPIKNKVALVTGANRGIGKAIVEALIQQGAAKVYAAVRNPASAQPLIEALGDKVVPIAVDLSKPETIEGAVKTAADTQLVINNAGVLRSGTILDDDFLESYEDQFGINVLGFLRIARGFAPVLKANGGGAFVQLNSIASYKNFAPFGLYAASKAASYNLTQSLRDLLKEQNTLVVSVHPGPIATDMADTAGLGDIAEPPSQVAEAIIAAWEKGEFHVYTDTMSRQFGEAYDHFAKNIIEADLQEA